MAAGGADGRQVAGLARSTYHSAMHNREPLVKLRYLLPGDERPFYHASRGGADAALRIGASFEDREVRIHNARDAAPPFSLDEQGFTLVGHETAVGDFYRLEDSRSAYEAELVDLVCAATGADAAEVFDHTLRSESPAVRGQHTTREPASVIHNDYTDASARKRLAQILPPEAAARRLERRFAIVNAWRSIAGPVWNSPMTCCDAATLAAGDLVAAERRAEERTGELELVTWNPEHRWWYYPEMTTAEVLLLKTFDSSLDGRARRTAHSAFNNPLAPADAPPRESIESRLLVFFD